MMKTSHSRQIATHDFLRSCLRALLTVSLALGLIGAAQAQQRGEGRAKISRELADELDGLTARHSLSALTRLRTFIVQTGRALNQHHLLQTATGESKVVYEQDFTGQYATGDAYGHGSHVASLVAGGDQVEAGAYRGIAPGAQLISLRVLDDNGQGNESSIIAALDW